MSRQRKIIQPWKKWKGISKKKKKRIALTAAALLLILAAGYTVFIAPMLQKEKWIYKEAKVERGDIAVGVVESGSLEYGITNISYDLDLTAAEEDSNEEGSAEESGTEKYLKIEEIYVSSGQRISEGEKLLTFTEDSVTDVRRLLQAAWADAQVAYNEAEAEYELSVLEAQTDYDTQKLSQSYASAIFQASKDSIDNDIAAMQVEVNQRTVNIPALEEKVAEAQESYDEALEAYESAGEFAVYLNAQNRYQAAKSSLEQAQEDVEENAEQIELLTAKIAVANAKRSIEMLEVSQVYRESVISGDNAQIIYNAKIEELKEDLQEAEEDKKEIEELLSAFETFVGEDGALYAGGTGIVTQVDYEEGDSLINKGTIIAYASPENMTISVDVTQEDVTALTVGDKVDIAFHAYEGAVYEGRILSINTTATSRASNTISYTVVIGVSGNTELLYGGMTADITFVTEEKKDVLYISKKSLVEQNDKFYVYTKTMLGGMELKEIQIGISNGTSVEVVSGLEAGETIYIASRISSETEIENTGTDTENSQAKGVQGGMEQGFGNSMGGENDKMPGMSDMPEMPDMSGMPDMPEGFGGMQGGFDRGEREARP